MTQNTLKKYMLAAAVAGVMTMPVMAQAADAPLTKDAVEAIVKDYIMNHPQDILTSVQEYQDRSARESQEKALKENHSDLYDADTPMAGNPNGDVTVVEFFDYNCGYCKKALPEIRKLIDSDKGVRVLFKEFPILGESSEKAARWALAAHKQGKYFEFHQKMMENHGAITPETLEKVAGDAGLDVAKAKSYTEGADVLVVLERNRTLGGNMSINGTPAFIVGDKVMPGAVNHDSLVKMVAEVRAAKKDAPKVDGKK